MNNFKSSFLTWLWTLTRTVRSRDGELAKPFKHETIAGIHRCRDVDRFQYAIIQYHNLKVSVTGRTGCYGPGSEQPNLDGR